MPGATCSTASWCHGRRAAEIPRCGRSHLHEPTGKRADGRPGAGATRCSSVCAGRRCRWTTRNGLSLAYIKNLALDELKTTRLSPLNTDEQRAIIIRPNIELGHSLGMTVVAEGVETAVELAALKQFGCDYAQGYHVCRPKRAEDLIAWLQAQPVAA
jgi:hypothetical protein